MFALAIWDQRRGELLLARDRLGKKPLVYRQDLNRLLFASELKSILSVPGVPREIDPGALDEYLTYGYVPPPNTMLRGIRKLPPAHRAIWRDGRLRVERYWQPPAQANQWHVDAAVEQLRSLLTSAVELRLHSDVPLGAFLSGGIDSSIVVGLMSRLSQTPVKTFTIGFADPEFDESGFARDVAAMHGAEHHELRIEPQAAELLPKLVWHYDEPFADSSALPTWYVSQLAREHVKVALTGDGGDELFAGYDRYRAVRLAARIDRLPASIRRGLACGCWQRLPGGRSQRSMLRKLKRFLSFVGESPVRRFVDWSAMFSEARRAELYTEEFLAELPGVDPVDYMAGPWRMFSGRDPVTTATLTDLVTYLPSDLMVKVDIASMAHGLECRQPLLDHRLVEFAAGLPIELKLRRGTSKYLLRQAFNDLLPPSVRKRGKRGFGLPVSAWFRGPLREIASELLTGATALRRGYFRPDAVRRLLDEHNSGAFDHGYRLWTLLVLEMWLREWIDDKMR
jgi:asparagine synthase (glutamine-hydrolysing)